MTSLFQDLKYADRTISKSPAFSAVAVLAVVAFVAAYPPAIRAARVNATDALRSE